VSARSFASVGLAALLLVTTARAQQPPAAHAPATPSTSVTVSGAVQHPKTLTLADLQNEPATTQSVFYVTGRGTVTASFTGVLLWTLLEAAEVKDDPAVKNAKLRHTVMVGAADGYSVALSLGELDPAYGAGQALIAYAQDGKPLGASGFARLILPADKDGGRNVMRISSIEVR
jgi:DMSO/TMAO reductase YedYZ molybdopterin-dependent catalytic subunit